MHHLRGESGPAEEEAVCFQGEIFTEPKGLLCHQGAGAVQKTHDEHPPSSFSPSSTNLVS